MEAKKPYGSFRTVPQRERNHKRTNRNRMLTIALTIAITKPLSGLNRAPLKRYSPDRRDIGFYGETTGSTFNTVST